MDGEKDRPIQVYPQKHLFCMDIMTLQESMDMCTGHLDITEIMFENGINYHKINRTLRRSLLWE